MLDYYQRPFLILTEAISDDTINGPHKKRRSYWKLVPEKKYSYLNSRSLVLGYYKIINKEIEKIVSSKSRMYWLHLSRRVSPNTSGKDDSPMTISICRKIIDGSIEKYGLRKLCKHINTTNKIDISEVLDGLLMADVYQYERNLIEQGPPQFVLTKFNQSNLLEYYELEMLAYEVWKCGAKLRAFGKGALLEVNHSNEDLFEESRSSELNFLIKNYDSRKESSVTFRKGVVIIENEKIDKDKFIVPEYNVNGILADDFNSLFEKLKLKIRFAEKTKSNFIPVPIPLLAF